MDLLNCMLKNWGRTLEINKGNSTKSGGAYAITSPSSTSKNNFSSALWALFAASFNCPTYTKCLPYLAN
jgi:hypothetical protein